MTVAKLTPGLPDGSGVTPHLAEKIYADLMAGKPVEHLVVVGLALPVGYAERSTEKGKRRTVTLAFDRLEPESDSHDADTVRHLVSAAYESRTSRPQLPLDFPGFDDAGQRTTLLTYLDEWATEEELDEAEVRELWADYFGGPGFAPADYRTASALQLREFAVAQGAIAEDSRPVETVQLPADDIDGGEPT